MLYASEHPCVKAIEDEAFIECSELTVVNLGEGLEEIGMGACHVCTSLHEILIPDAVKKIKSGHSVVVTGLRL
jgi:hypothetical protein